MGAGILATSLIMPMAVLAQEPQPAPPIGSTVAGFEPNYQIHLPLRRIKNKLSATRHLQMLFTIL